MPPQVATLAFIIGILGLFWLARDYKARTSIALWLPVAWILFVITSTKWIHSGITTAAQIEGSPIERSVFSLLIASGIIVLLARGRKVFRVLRMNAPILFYILYCGISVLWSDYPGVAFKRWIKLVGVLVMVLIVLTDPDRLTAIKRFMTRAGFLLIPVSVLFIEYYPHLGRAYDPRTGDIFLGVTNNKNSLGVVCLLFGLGAVWGLAHALRERERRRKGQIIAYGSVLAMALWLLIKANSMTALVCFVLASGLMVATGFRMLERKRALVKLLVVMVIAATAFPIFVDRGTGLLKMVGRTPTITGRTRVWHDVLEIHTNPLVGTGFDSFWLGKRLEIMWTKEPWRPNEAHNGYLEVYLNLGLVGLLLLGFVIATGYRNATGRLRREPETARFSLACLVVATVYSFAEAGFRMLNPVWFFFLLAAVAIPENRALEATFAEDSLVQDVTPEFRYMEDEEDVEQVRLLQAERSESSGRRKLDFGLPSQ